jgi:hypothetical protein
MPDPSDDALLDVNDLVRVNVAGNAKVGNGAAAEGARTRIENIDRTGGRDDRPRYVVAAPRYEGDVEPPAPGTPCTLEWPGERGVWILPVTFVQQEEVREGLRAWTLDVIGAPRQNERREYVRVTWSVPIMLAMMTAAEIRQAVAQGMHEASIAAPRHSADLPTSLAGMTRNVSEGGVSCQLPAPQLPEGLAVSARIELAGESFTVPSRIVRVRPTGVVNGYPFTAAVAFDNPARYGDRLRPLLFAEQLRIRRAGLS